MGLLVLGVPCNWSESKKHHAYVKKHGILQFLNIYFKCKDRRNDKFLWGDEVEGLVVKFSADGIKLCLRAPEILEQLDNYIKEKQ